MASCTSVKDEGELHSVCNVVGGVGSRVFTEGLVWFCVCVPVDRSLHIISHGEHGEVLLLVVVGQQDMIVVGCQHCHQGGIVVCLRSGNIGVGYQHVAFTIEHDGIVALGRLSTDGQCKDVRCPR